MRLYLDLIAEVFSGVGPWFRILIGREDSRIMDRFVPMDTLRRRGEDAAWFDGECRHAFELKQSAYHR